MKIEIAKISKGKQCEYPNCRKNAINLVWQRDIGLGIYCNYHVNAIENREAMHAEYIAHCPNCGCGFGVN